MVAYSFQRQFCQPILDRTKGGTIRAPRIRPHAQPGQSLQLYSGMRTKSCRRISTETCMSIECIALFFATDRVGWCHVESPAYIWRSIISEAADLDRLAVFDGFRSWEEMKAFWNGTGGPFFGFHIRWMPWS